MANYYTRKDSVLLEYYWPTNCVKQYIPLTVFCYTEKYTKPQATTVARKLISTETTTHTDHSKVHGKITEDISDLFIHFDEVTCSPFIFLIEGAAGIGKSMLCNEIALQWTNGNILKNRTLLFLLSMNDPKINKLTNVELIVKHFIQCEKLANKISHWLITTNGKYVTIIIDGYNEDCENSFITDSIVKRKILAECSLVITSRSASLSCVSNVNYMALVLGFTRNNQILYIDNVLKGSNSKINYLKAYLQSNPIINDLCNIPLFMNLLLYHFVEEEIRKFPITQISWIQKYIVTIIKEKSVTSLTEDLPHPYDQVIKDLAQFAFITIQLKDHPTFTLDDDLKSCENHYPDFPNKLFKVGLLNKIYFQVQNVNCEMFHFCHETIQEYLAAYYISLLPDEELSKLLDTFWNICYLNVWIMYVSLNGGKSSIFKYFLSKNQTLVKKEKDSDLDKTLQCHDIDLKQQKLSHNHLRTLALLLSKSSNKQWKNLKLSNCDIDGEGCNILYETLCSRTEIKFETVDISYNNFCWESFHIICSMLKNWHTKKLIFSVNTLYDTETIIEINRFTEELENYFQINEFSDEILMLTYLAKQKKLIAVYSSPSRIRFFQWRNCELNEGTIKQVKDFVKFKVINENFNLVFSYSIVDHHAKNLSTLLSNFQNVQLCGSYLHSEGAYLLNTASCTIDSQYSSPQELKADYIAAVLCHHAQSPVPYLESLPAAHATIVRRTLQDALSLSVFDISDNSETFNSQIATEIATILSLTSTLQLFYASNNNLLAEDAIRIAKGLQNCSTLTVCNMSNNNICEKAADDISIVLSRNSNLQGLLLSNNSFKTIGMIKIAKALKHITTLTTFNVSNNKVGEEAAYHIATVLSNNTKLQELHLSKNSFKTIGMITITKALKHISTLTAFNVSNNKVGEEAADDIATVLSHNTKLKELHLGNNKLKTVGIIKIMRALQSVLNLTALDISNNNVDEEAADNIATVLSHNSKLKEVYLHNNNFKTVGITKIAKALQNTSTLMAFNISNNSIGEEAAYDIAKVLSHNNKLKKLCLHNNNIKAVGIIKIIEALQNISTLIELNISNNDVGEEAADHIAKILSCKTQLRICKS